MKEYLLLLAGAVVVAVIVITLLLQISDVLDATEGLPETDLFVGDCIEGDFFHLPSDTYGVHIGKVDSFFVENSELYVLVRLTNPDSQSYRTYLPTNNPSLKKIRSKYCEVLE